MWLSSEAYHAGSNSLITPTCNHLQNHLRQGKYRGARDIFPPTSGHPGVSQVVYRRIDYQKELPWAAFLPYDPFRLNEVPTYDQDLILLIFLADSSISPPDCEGSGVVCVEQRRK